MLIPKKVKIGGVTYDVIKDYTFTERSDIVGQADHSTLQIKLAKLDGNEPIAQSRLEEVFIHETLHAIDAVYNASKLVEEDVMRLSNGLYQVFKDNKIF